MQNTKTVVVPAAVFLLFLFSVKQFLNSPLPQPDRRSIIKETLFLTAYTLFVLFLFQPFGTYEYTHPYKLVQLAGYGLLMLVAYPLLRTAVSKFPFSAYSVKNEAWLLPACFFVMSVLGFFYHGLVIDHELNWQHLFPFIINSMILLTPPLFALLYLAYVKVKRGESIQSSPTESSRLFIKGTNQREDFYFNAADVVYLKSNGNYVMVYFQRDGSLRHEMVRNTLNQVGRQIAGADFMPVHRSFLANTKHFDKLVREDGKHFLVNQQFDLRLPVSRHHVPSIEKKLKDFS